MEVKTYKREDGTRVKVCIDMYIGYTSRNHLNVNVSLCNPGKRKFNPVCDTDSCEYRYGTMEEREKMRKKDSMKYISEDELNECINLFFENIKNDLILYFN